MSAYPSQPSFWIRIYIHNNYLQHLCTGYLSGYLPFSSLLPFVLLSWLIDPHFCSLEEYSTSDFFTLTLLSLAALKTFQAGVIVRQKHINESSLVLNEISLVLIGILEFISHQFCWFCCSVQLCYYCTNKLRHLLKIITLLNEKFYLTLPTCGGHTC